MYSTSVDIAVELPSDGHLRRPQTNRTGKESLRTLVTADVIYLLCPRDDRRHACIALPALLRFDRFSSTVYAHLSFKATGNTNPCSTRSQIPPWWSW